MQKKLAFGFGLMSYLVFLITFLYAIGFTGNLIVPKGIDAGSGDATWGALLINLALVGLFGLQHSVMARRSFKRWWTRIIPRPVERSTYVLLTSLILLLIFWQWRPMTGTVWDIEPLWARVPLWGAFALGWLLVFISARMINSAHLFGMQQVKAHLHGEQLSAPEFQTPALYRHVRHPLMLGFLIAFWAAPTMTLGHLIFAAAMSGYILIGLQFEERSLVRRFGDRYRAYRQQVPMLIPRLRPEPRLDERIGIGAQATPPDRAVSTGK